MKNIKTINQKLSSYFNTLPEYLYLFLLIIMLRLKMRTCQNFKLYITILSKWKLFNEYLAGLDCFSYLGY